MTIQTGGVRTVRWRQKPDDPCVVQAQWGKGRRWEVFDVFDTPTEAQQWILQKSRLQEDNDATSPTRD